MEYPNKGTLFLTEDKKSEKFPDMNGYIKIERDYLKQLMDKGESLVEIKLSGWKKTFASGKKGVSLAVDTYVKSDAPSAPISKSQEKDPWE
jgi:hypothetical protein